MRLLDCAPALVAMTMALLLQGCAKEDGSRIIGHWRAERFELMGLKLPLGPELEITPTMLAVSETGVRLPLTGLSEDDDEVTLETDANIGLSFRFVEADRMYVEVPFIDRIYYRRLAGNLADAATAPEAVAVPKPTAAAVDPATLAGIAPQRSVAKAAALQPSPLLAAWSAAYDAARSAARDGDDDAAVRHLYQAYHDGWRDSAIAARTPEFARLQADVRFQALLARLNGT